MPKLSAYLTLLRITSLAHEVITPSNAPSFEKWELHQADLFYFSATVFIYIHWFFYYHH